MNGSPGSCTVRDWRDGDWARAWPLWQACELTLGVSDREEEVARLVARNPDLSLVAEVGDRLVGTVLGGFDGRRGLIHHLAVHPEFRRRGIGRRLVEALEARFRRLGVVKINFWVERRNPQAVEAWRRLGYVERDLITMSKVLHPGESLSYPGEMLR